MHAESRGPTYRLILAGLLLWTIAAVSYGVVRLTFGPRPVYVHVRWASEVDEAARQRLEGQYHLTQGEPRDGRTWGYALVDLSRDNIRALVGNASVEDTHQIHRTAFRVGYLVPRLPYPTPHAWIAIGLEILTAFCVLGGAIAFGLALLGAATPGIIRGPLVALRNVFLEPRATLRGGAVILVTWLRGRIPSASPEAAALFRIVFGGTLLNFLLRHPVPAAWAAESPNVVSPAHEFLLSMVAGASWLVDWIPAWLAWWGALFLVGAMTRTAFAMLTVGAFAWALLYTTRTTYHTISALLVALVCLLWARWGDAWSIDAWRRRSRPAQRRTPQEYGYAVWVPSFVLGVAFAAAAFAKLRDSGLAWILNGTVKYHFLSDSKQAMVDWGLQLGRHHRVAVLLSLGAIVIELLVIAGVVSRMYRYRALAGLASMSILGGFALFQGLFWPGWWMLLLSFLPWHLVRPASTASATAERDASMPQTLRRLLAPAPVAVVVTFIVVQLVVSTLRLEVSPLISTYDMYSTTYASPAEYEQKAGQEYWLVAADDQAQLHECRVTPVEADIVLATAPASGLDSSTGPVLRRCFEPSLRVASLLVESRRASVNWAEWRLEEPARTRLTEPISAK